MKITDGRGSNKIMDARQNKKAVKNWFKKNPNSTITECCNGLNLTYTTVRKHINSLIGETTNK